MDLYLLSFPGQIPFRKDPSLCTIHLTADRPDRPDSRGRTVDFHSDQRQTSKQTISLKLRTRQATPTPPTMKLFQYTISLRYLFQSRAGMYSASKRVHGLPISSTMQVKDVHLQASNEGCNSFHTWKFLLASGGAAATLLWCLRTHAQCQSVDQSTLKEQSERTLPPSPSLPLITLYQYQTCPYCSKARAFLEYYGVKYEKVEVNPVFRSETKSFKYRKLPFIVAEGLQVRGLVPRPIAAISGLGMRQE